MVLVFSARGFFLLQENFEYLCGIWKGEVDSQRHRDFHSSVEARLLSSFKQWLAVLGMFLSLPDPDPKVKGTDPAPHPSLFS
jgi:hypothetical protein